MAYAGRRSSMKQLMILLSCLFFLNGCGTAETAQAEVTAAVPAPAETVAAEKQAAEYELADTVLRDYRTQLEETREINADEQAIIAFHSGLCVNPVLKNSGDTDYLYTDWKTGEYLSYGSIVLDQENDLSGYDMNLILYGHYIYEFRNKDRSLVFTPLVQLMEEGNYEDNRYVSLITETEIRYYEIASVFPCPMVKTAAGQVCAPDFQYNLVEYDEVYFKRYLNAIEKAQYYDTGVILCYGDRLLTLQTCIEDHPESRLIVLCKEIERRKF